MSRVDKNELKIIFQGLKNGDENSIELLYSKYYSTIYGVAFSILKNKDNSEDVVHNVFMKIMKMDKELLPNQGEASWLYTVTKNEVLQFLRRQKVSVDIDDMYTIEAENSEIDEYLDLSSYHKLLEKLDPLEKEIVSLRIISDFTFDKIAQMLDLPLGTVQWKYYKSLHYIKQTITSLATFVVLITTLQFIKINSTQFRRANYDVETEDSSVNTNSNRGVSSETKNTRSSSSSSSNSWGGTSVTFDDISSSSITNGAQDNTGTASTASTVVSAVLTLTMIVVTVFFAIITAIFLFRKKVKKKKK